LAEKARKAAVFASYIISWMMCYAELTILTIEDHIYFVRRRNRFMPVRRQMIASLDQNEAENLTGFMKAQLQLLYLHWRVPDEFHEGGHYTFEGEECMLVFLADLRKGQPFTWMAKYVFGGDPREYTFMVRAFTNHLYETFYHKISGNSMEYWIPHVHDFRRAIWNRLVRGCVTTIDYDEWNNAEETSHHYVQIPFENF
jgi:hypothetical protein